MLLSYYFYYFAKTDLLPVMSSASNPQKGTGTPGKGPSFWKEIFFGSQRNEPEPFTPHDFVPSKFKMGSLMLFTRIFAVFIVIIPIYYLFETKITAVMQQSAPRMMTMTAPAGEGMEIELPDGTMVLLDAGSELKYRTKFRRNFKDVFLTGSATIRVANKPYDKLTVHMGSAEIDVFDAHFQVMAPDPAAEVQIQVMDGDLAFIGDEGESRLRIGTHHKVTYAATDHTYEQEFLAQP